MPDSEPRRYGWKPDLPDARDLIFAAPAVPVGQLPDKVDLREQCPPVYDQGRIGSCTSNAISGAYEFGLNKQQLTDFVPSRLFIYYNERTIEGSVGFDAGAMIRDGIKSVHKLGVCPESEWPYDDTPPVNAGDPWPAGAKAGEKPTDACYQDALKNTATVYRRVVRDLDQFRGCLAEGYPFVLGFSVYSGFESADVAAGGVMNLPGPDEDLLGGHAVLAVGYDDAGQRFLVRNSWGPGWGQDGYFTMPYTYLTQRSLSADFWTLRTVS
jgi:C1A family cysteine protease